MKLMKKLAVSLLGIMCVAGAVGGVAGCKAKKNPVETPKNNTTYRLALPNDGSLPTAHTALENIGYMATRLDNQYAYHAYAKNSTKSLGYEQITQTWKDYKGKEASGYDGGVMICSDISYSSFVKSGTQACFINDSAYMRSSGKPGKSTTATTAEWNTGTPEYYDKESYLDKYGEFSTELTVYVINEDTIDRADEIVVNGNGTYSQKYYLKNNAACYYQYKMKTNGSLKGYPDFDYINITFTFDDSWQVLETYCEEKAKISPKALGGSPMTSNSKTTTTFDYSSDALDTTHYGYFDSYYKQYLGADLKPGTSGGGSSSTEGAPDILDVLGGAFGKVITEGDQFALNLKIGETDYDGKVYLQIGNLSDALNSIDARVSLGKTGSGNQDLYIGFKNGAVNAYYSNDFAATVSIDAVKTVVGQFSEWAKRFDAPSATPVKYSLTEEEGGLDLSSLLAALDFTYTDTEVNVALKTDDLLGTGIGVDVNLAFGRQKDGDDSTYTFKNATLSSITYDSTSIKLSGSISNDDSAIISRDPSQTVADLAEYAAGVYGLLNSNTVKVNLAIDEGEKSVSLLNGVSLNGEAYVELGSKIATSLSFTVGYNGLSAKLSAYYDVNIHGGNYGKVYLNLEELNGEAQNIKVYSNISDTLTAVNQLIDTINAGSATPAALSDGQDTSSLVGIINGVLNLNFEKIIGGLYASNSQIRVAVDLDEIITGVGVDVKGMKFGTAALALNMDGNKKASLNLSLAALGLTMNVEGSDKQLTQPNLNNYLDATALVNIVKAATVEAQKIISAQDIIFDIDATVTADNIPLSVKGGGEVVWKNNKLTLAAAVDMSVADGTNSDKVKLTVVYDDTVGEDKPLAKFAVNGLAMEIYRKDLKQISDGIKTIKNNIDLLINGNKTGNSTASAAIATVSGVSAQAGGATLTIEEILTNSNVQNILSAVLGFAGDLNFSLGKTDSNGDYNKLIINHAANGSLTLATNGNLALSLTVKNDGGDEIVEIEKAEVKAGNGAKISTVRAALDEMDVYTTATQTPEKFAKIVYTYLFAVVEGQLSVENVLGSKTYTVHAVIDGNASQVSQLAGISVDATLYYSQGLDGTTVKKDKLIEVDLNLDIKGTAVKANARYAGQTLYVSLDKIGNTELTDIKFKADRNDIYGLCEQLVTIITDEEIVNTVAGLLHKGGASTASIAPLAENSKSALTDMLVNVLSLDFAKAVSLTSVNGVNTAVIELDYITETLGVNAPALGTVTASVDSVKHDISASLAYAQAEPWATLTAVAANRRTYADGWTDGYINIGFVKNILSDLLNTLTDTDGKVHQLYTFSGDANIHVYINLKQFIGISIPINVDVPLDIVTLTAGFDSDNDFYLSLVADLKSVSAVGFTITEAGRISITYSGNYITFGRGIGTESEIFKVTTLNYAIDHLFVKHENGTESPLRWMLGMSDTVWNIIAGQVNISSGLTTPQTYYLYNQLAQASSNNGGNAFYLSQILNGFAVNINGSEVASYGSDTKAATQLGLTDNYYAFDINARKLTNGMLSSLYAGLLRSDDQGIYGLAASGGMNMSGIKLSFGLTLDKYLEGVTETEGTFGEVAAPNYFKKVEGIDFSDPEAGKTLFGCYNSEDGSYDPSVLLDKVTLTVMNRNNEVSVQEKLATGSTVYLTNSFSPVWADDGHTSIIVYTATAEADAKTNNLGTEMVITADTTIYEKTIDAVEVNFILGVDGMVVNGAFANNSDALPEYPLGGYTFVGWYNDAAFENGVNTVGAITTTENGVKTVYGYYEAETVTVNGVMYSFSPDSKTYAVSGYDADAIKPYTVSGSVLKLESSIQGVNGTYNVTAIDAQAFKSMGKSTDDGGIGAGLKNVIVPATITTVGAEAFMDNYGMETAVFLASEITFGGSSWTGDGDRFVFYGTGKTDNEKETNLKLYYNSVSNSTNAEWNAFHSFKSGTANINTNYNYIGVIPSGKSDNMITYYHAYGELINNDWAYVEYTQTGVDFKDNGLNCLVGGATTTQMTDNKIKEAVMAELNGRTYGEYINGYEVTVSGGYTLDGALHAITVNITEATPYYKLTINSNQTGIVAKGTVESYEESYYAKAGTTVTLSRPNGYTIGNISAENVTFTAGEDGAYTFTMPAKQITVSATCNKEEIKKVTVISEFAYEDAGGTSYSTQEELENVTTLPTPVKTGYTFIGWAYMHGETLEFTTSNVQYSTYYAIWAVNRTGEIDKIENLPVSGSELSEIEVTVNKTAAHSFYGWYTDYTFGTQVTQISTEHTVLYARLNFNVLLDFTHSNAGTTSNTNVYYRNNVNASQSITKTSRDGQCSNNKFEIPVAEGKFVRLDMDSNRKVLFVYILDNANDSVNASSTDTGYRFRGYKSGLSSDERNMMYASDSKAAKFASGTWYASNAYGTDNAQIASTTNYYAETSYTIDSTTYYYGAMAKVDGYLEVDFNL